MFENGHYKITWPWKNNGFQLCDNYPVAMERIRMLVKCLHSDKDLLHKYDKIIQQQVKNNVIEAVDVTKLNKK